MKIEPKIAAASAELTAILRVMAKRQNFVLPDGIESSLDPWIKLGMRNKAWGQAREMRTLLERAREAQATRIAHDPSGDVRQLAKADIDAAIRISPPTGRAPPTAAGAGDRSA